MLNRILKPLISVSLFVMLALSTLLGASTATATQLLETEEFNLSVNTAFCEPGYLGPFVGCTPWGDVTVSVLYESPSGTVSDACVTVPGERTASCSVNVPYGQTVTALINPAMIPAGYVLEGSTEVQFTVPDGPPEGLVGGVSFVLFQAEAPVEPAEPEGFPFGANTAFCDPGYFGPFVDCTPWEGVTVNFVSTDGTFATSCVTSGSERAGGCGIDVPFGSTIIASIDPAQIPAGYVLEGATEQEFTIPNGPPEGLFGGAAFVLLPAEGPAEPTQALPADAPAPTTPPADTGTIEQAGMPGAIYAGSCDTLPEASVVSLADAVEPSGATVGAPDAVPVATSYTALDIPFDMLLDGTHVLAIFDANDPETVVSCGGIGGALDSTGALAVGLLPEGDEGYAAVTYISPVDDGAGSAVTLFVSMPSPEEEG